MTKRSSSHAQAGLPMPLKPLPPDEIEPDQPRTPPAPVPEEADDFEYEVEAVDPQILAGEKARAQETLAQAEKKIDVDEIYRDLDGQRDFEFDFESIKARFGIRSLLIATTVVAVLLTLWQTGILLSGQMVAGLICLTLLGLGTAHAWLGHQERRRREELIAKRHAQLRAARVGSDDEDEEGDEPEDSPGKPAGLPALPRFGVMDLLKGIAVAAVLLTLLKLTGSSGRAAGAMGALAITGFAVQAADIDIPRPLLIGWWMTLLGYCVLTLFSIFG